VLIERCTLFARQPLEDRLHVGFDVGQLLGLQHAFEHIKAAPPIGRQDVWRQSPVGIEPDRPAVAEREGSRFARP
jgi:hypothetical protein